VEPTKVVMLAGIETVSSLTFWYGGFESASLILFYPRPKAEGLSKKCVAIFGKKQKTPTKCGINVSRYYTIAYIMS